jgi:hypothetical protein
VEVVVFFLLDDDDAGGGRPGAVKAVELVQLV